MVVTIVTVTEVAVAVVVVVSAIVASRFEVVVIAVRLEVVLVVLPVSLLTVQGRIQDFSKGGSQGNGYMYKLYYIHIAIIHIIILNEKTY